MADDGKKPIYKRDIYTKNLILSLSPTQWKKLRYIAKHNKKTLNEQLRVLVDHVIRVFEQSQGEIILEDTPPKIKQ